MDWRIILSNAVSSVPIVFPWASKLSIFISITYTCFNILLNIMVIAVATAIPLLLSLLSPLPWSPQVRVPHDCSIITLDLINVILIVIWAGRRMIKVLAFQNTSRQYGADNQMIGREARLNTNLVATLRQLNDCN